MALPQNKNISKRLSSGISANLVKKLSSLKNEPFWMKDYRLAAYLHFVKTPLPKWGQDLSEIDFTHLTYYARNTGKLWKKWQDVPAKLRNYFDKLGIPEAEKKYLAGLEIQYDSEPMYTSAKNELRRQGVIFCDTNTALRDYPKLVKKYFGKLISAADNKFAALNSAMWSGGSFVYVPENVQVSMPINAFFRMNEPRFGQFERTLIIVEKNSSLDYIEGCTAPTYADSVSLHAAVVEIFVGENAQVTYSTVQNWSNNIYNLVTKRALVKKSGNMKWVDANIGSKVTMKYPSSILEGDNSSSSIFSIGIAGEGQVLDTGTKMIHLGKNTSSVVVSKSISKKDGHNQYRGLIQINPTATNARSAVNCDALLLDKQSTAATLPVNRIKNTTARLEHEASVSVIDERKLFYLQTRGMTVEMAKLSIISGFVEEVVDELPLEFAVEFNKLLELEFTDAVG